MTLPSNSGAQQPGPGGQTLQAKGNAAHSTMDEIPEPPFPARDPKWRKCTMSFDIEQYRGHDPQTGEPLTDKQFIQQLTADLLGGLPDGIDLARRCMSSLLNRMPIVKVICLGCGVSAGEAQIFEVGCVRAVGKILSYPRYDQSGKVLLDKSGKPSFKQPTLKQFQAMKRIIAPAMGAFVSWLQNELMPAVVARRYYMAGEPTPTAATTAKPVDAEKPLTEKQTCVVRILAGCEPRKGLMGKEIISAAIKLGETIEQSDLTKNIIPRLRVKGIHIENERGAGYYLVDANQHTELKAQFAKK
ncbi:MAG: hypothetical protein ACYCUV_12960 [Phycisphaerae bacterium]